MSEEKGLENYRVASWATILNYFLNNTVLLLRFGSPIGNATPILSNNTIVTYIFAHASLSLTLQLIALQMSIFFRVHTPPVQSNKILQIPSFFSAFSKPKPIHHHHHHNLLPLCQMILLPNRLHQHFQRLHLPFGQQSKFRAKEHEMFKTRIQMRSHLQCLQRAEEAAVYDAVNAEQAAKDLAAQRGERRRLEDAEGLGLVVVVGEFRLVVDLIGDPLEDAFDVDRGRDGDGLLLLLLLWRRWL